MWDDFKLFIAGVIVFLYICVVVAYMTGSKWLHDKKVLRRC